MSRPESSRNQYIYPEKQTPTDRLASRLQTSLSEYLNPELSDDDFDGLALTIKGIARRFVEEVKVDMVVPGVGDSAVSKRARVRRNKKPLAVNDEAIYGTDVFEISGVPGGVL